MPFNSSTYILIEYQIIDDESKINLKYYPSEGRKISIFIFKSGKIIITSAKKTQELNQAYHFINDILDKYKPYSKLNIF